MFAKLAIIAALIIPIEQVDATTDERYRYKAKLREIRNELQTLQDVYFPKNHGASNLPNTFYNPAGYQVKANYIPPGGYSGSVDSDFKNPALTYTYINPTYGQAYTNTMTNGQPMPQPHQPAFYGYMPNYGPHHMHQPVAPMPPAAQPAAQPAAASSSSWFGSSNTTTPANNTGESSSWWSGQNDGGTNTAKAEVPTNQTVVPHSGYGAAKIEIGKSHSSQGAYIPLKPTSDVPVYISPIVYPSKNVGTYGNHFYQIKYSYSASENPYYGQPYNERYNPDYKKYNSVYKFSYTRTKYKFGEHVWPAGGSKAPQYSPPTTPTYPYQDGLSNIAYYYYGQNETDKWTSPDGKLNDHVTNDPRFFTSYAYGIFYTPYWNSQYGTYQANSCPKCEYLGPKGHVWYPHLNYADEIGPKTEAPSKMPYIVGASLLALCICCCVKVNTVKGKDGKEEYDLSIGNEGTKLG